MEEDPTILPDIEKATYLDFHEWAYKDSMELAGYVLEKSPRWTIVISYFGMHDITKLHLGKIHNQKVSGADIHAKTIRVLKKCMREEKTREMIIEELEKAKEKYELFVEGDETALLDISRQAREERAEHQYYQSRFSSSVFEERIRENAKDFLNNTAKPFIELMENLMKEGGKNAGKHPRQQDSMEDS